jgi:hypothetical protein
MPISHFSEPLMFLCMLLIKMHEISQVTMTLCFKFGMAIIVSFLLNSVKSYYIKHDFSTQTLYLYIMYNNVIYNL